MTPQEIFQFVEREYEDVVVEVLDQGFSFWLGRKQISPDSTHLVRAIVKNGRTMLKRVATSLEHGRNVKENFVGDIGDLREIFNAERLLVRNRQQTVVANEAPELSFEINVTYDRRTQIHRPFWRQLPKWDFPLGANASHLFVLGRLWPPVWLPRSRGRRRLLLLR